MKIEPIHIGCYFLSGLLNVSAGDHEQGVTAKIHFNGTAKNAVSLPVKNSLKRLKPKANLKTGGCPSAIRPHKPNFRR